MAAAARSSPWSAKEREAFTDLITILQENGGQIDYLGAFKAVSALHDNQLPDAVSLCVSERSPMGSTVLRELFRRWGKTDARAALARAHALPAQHQRAVAMRGIASGWADSDPTAATAYGKTMPRGLLKNEFLGGLIEKVADRDSQAAIALLQEFPAYQQSSLTEPLFNALAAKSGRNAIAAAQNLPKGYLRDRALSACVDSWSQKNPQDAFNWARALTNSSQKSTLLQQVFSNWAALDPKGAAGALGDVKELLDFAHCQIATEWASQDVGGALQWAAGLEEGMKKDVMLNIVETWSCKDPEAARQWVLNLPSEEERDRLLQIIIPEWSKYEPREAAEWLEQLTDNDTRYELYSTLAPIWGSQDPIGAKEWVERLHDDSPHDELAMGVASAWAAKEPQAALDWLLTQPCEVSRDSLLALFSENTSNDAPRASMQAIDLISDETLKAETLEKVAVLWIAVDPAAAHAWADGKHLPEHIAKIFRK